MNKLLQVISLLIILICSCVNADTKCSTLKSKVERCKCNLIHDTRLVLPKDRCSSSTIRKAFKKALDKKCKQDTCLTGYINREYGYDFACILEISSEVPQDPYPFCIYDKNHKFIKDISFTIPEDTFHIKQDSGKITHKRSKIYDFLDKSLRKKLEKIREKNFEKDNLKKSTDILIYTDSFCFSAGSGFIKAFQNTGGAIIVGFNGNPKIDKNEFDGSQSSSSVSAFKDEEYYNLESLGYNIIGITYSESFDDSYKNINPIPREYTVDIVDERVPIYGPYSDDLYNDFINEAEKIFQKYEIKNECNKNNPRLLLDDKNCELKDKRKGGHPCGEDGKWDITKCEAYYCELGYYYDQIKKECVLDICTNGKERDIYFENEDYMKTKEYELQPDKEMVFHLKNDSYYYFFESNAENIFSLLDNSPIINLLLIKSIILGDSFTTKLLKDLFVLFSSLRLL